MTYNNNTYYYVRNIMGDIIGITDANGNQLVTYTYDPYGNLIGFDYDTDEGWEVGYLNPFRFKGYYFDNETGFYYCNSRYYVPEFCRFLNADEIDVLGATPMGLTDKNLYAYCDNNPAMREDDGGEFWNTIIGAVAGAIVGGVSAAIMGTDIKAGIVSGAVSGAIAGAVLDITIATGGTGLVAMAAVAGGSGLGNAAGSYVNQRMNGVDHEDVDWGTVAIDGVWGVAAGMLTFGIADVGGPSCQTLKSIFSQPAKQIAQQATDDLVMTTTITAGTWLNGTKMNTLRKQATISRGVRTSRFVRFR